MALFALVSNLSLILTILSNHGGAGFRSPEHDGHNLTIVFGIAKGCDKAKLEGSVAKSFGTTLSMGEMAACLRESGCDCDVFQLDRIGDLQAYLPAVVKIQDENDCDGVFALVYAFDQHNVYLVSGNDISFIAMNMNTFKRSWTGYTLSSWRGHWIARRTVVHFLAGLFMPACIFWLSRFLRDYFSHE